MALFDWVKNRFYGKKVEKKVIELNASDTSNLPEIKEEVQAVKSTSEAFTSILFGKEIQVDAGIDSVYYFLATDLEKMGYKDSLTNMDASYMQLNLDKIVQELLVVIEDAQIFYGKKIKDFDFHISSRNQIGMTTTAEGVGFEKNKIEEILKILKKIETDALNKDGKCKILLLSYEKGFKKGLAALTEAKIFGKKIDDQ